MNKYKNLLSNTVIFGVSTFGSKILVLLLQRIYTSILSPNQFSVIDMITSTCNLILPIMYLSIAESVIRFGMDNSYKKSDVLSVGILTVLIGYICIWIIYPLLSKIESVKGYTYLIYIYILTSALRTVITQFVRASGFIRMFAIDGIVTTIFTIGLNLLFLLKFDMGIVGYIMGIVLADGISAIGLFLILRLYRFFKVRNIDHHTIVDMLRYSLPLIPTAISWWIINLSDKYFVQAICGDYINGLYGKSYLVPTIITLVSAVFTRAWEISAFTEYRSEKGERFFSNVFRSYYSLIFIGASTLILLIKPVIVLILDTSYFQAWKYVPFLVLAASFSCLVTFLGSIYNAAKKNIMISVTTFIGAGFNIGLNAILISKIGAQGAAFSTFVSFLIVFIIRAIDVRKYIKIKMQPIRMIMSLILLVIQALIALRENNLWVLWELIVLFLLLMINLQNVLFLSHNLLFQEKKNKKKN